MTQPMAPRPGPDLAILPEAPVEFPGWVVHPNPVWLRLQTADEGISTVVRHVSNIEYVRWIDHAAERALGEAGWSYADLLDRNRMFFVARHEIDYRREALPDETLFIATWVRDVRRVKSWRDTIVWRIGEEGTEIICTASTLWVQVDLETRRPTRISTDMSDALRPLQHETPPWRERT